MKVFKDSVPPRGKQSMPSRTFGRRFDEHSAILLACLIGALALVVDLFILRP